MCILLLNTYYRNIDEAHHYKAREMHVFVLYCLYTCLRVVDESAFRWSNKEVDGEKLGENVLEALRFLLCGLHLVKGFSLNVS